MGQGRVSVLGTAGVPRSFKMEEMLLPVLQAPRRDTDMACGEML